MKLRTLTGLVLATGAVACAAGIAFSAHDAPPAPSALIGVWRLDKEASENPAPPERGGGRGFGRGGREGGTGGGGRWGGGSGDDAHRPSRGGRLPDVLRIEETGNTLSLEDSVGAVVQEIAIGKGKDNDLSEDVVKVSGEWKGDKLEVKREGPRGGKMTEVYSVADEGRTLVIQRKAEFGGHGAREWKRVYRRVSS
jgi:hypothetical protein